jgi:hypothetical protein
MLCANLWMPLIRCCGIVSNQGSSSSLHACNGTQHKKRGESGEPMHVTRSLHETQMVARMTLSTCQLQHKCDHQLLLARSSSSEPEISPCKHCSHYHNWKGTYLILKRHEHMISLEAHVQGQGMRRATCIGIRYFWIGSAVLCLGMASEEAHHF